MSRRYGQSNRRRKFGQRKRSPESIFWSMLLVFLLLVGMSVLGYFLIFSPWLIAGAGRTETLPTAVDIEEPEQIEHNWAWEPKVPVTHTSILLLGLDSHGMCDVIMVVSYDMKTFESSLVSIKRDTFVPFQQWAGKEAGQDHLAWANNRGMGREKDYHAGAMLTALTVEELLGIDLHAYASVTFEGFTELVDLIGGVEINVDPAFANREGGALPTGLQRLNGDQALIYARHRQNPRIPEPESASQAEDRVIRNQRLLKAILEQGKTLESDELEIIIEGIEDRLYTSMDSWDILALANVMYNRDLDAMRSEILPGEGEIVKPERIDHETYYFFLDFEKTNAILQELGLK
jgi:polyisoprenyl-teichoic acid--peptidoglycan teichoic acid transferase